MSDATAPSRRSDFAQKDSKTPPLKISVEHVLCNKRRHQNSKDNVITHPGRVINVLSGRFQLPHGDMNTRPMRCRQNHNEQ